MEASFRRSHRLSITRALALIFFKASEATTLWFDGQLNTI
tara:strand:- start:184 stop:303 length:120 start_codon:yes stop_codon:yes gene_type:complete